MRRVLMLLLFSVCAISSHAQNYNPNSLPHFRSHHRRLAAPGTLTVLGGGLIVVGATVTTYGILYSSDGNKNNNNNHVQLGQKMENIGIPITCVGLGLAIWGIIRDHHHPKRDWWSIAAPRNNEMGIAFSF